jgi:hypothetical protein
MGNFTKSIVRGAGSQIGRSIAQSAINSVLKGSDAKYVNVNSTGGQRGPKAARDVVKASKFEFSGSNKAETVENKLFNLISLFEDQIKEDRSYFFEDLFTVSNKLNDAYEFFKFKEYITDKIDELKSKFFNLVNITAAELKKYHAEQLPIKQAKLKKLKRDNIMWFIIGFSILPIIGWLVIGSTKALKSEIELHEKLSKLNINLS